MKYCSHCGKELLDDACFCPGCGCKVKNSYSDTNTYNETNDTLGTIAKVFLVLGCVAGGLCWLIPLCWCIPMTVVAFRKINNHERIGLGFKICTLIFVSLIAGILLLCMDD